MADPILAFGDWKDNAELIESCRDLGYLSDDWSIWDAIYGLGAFWRLWRPKGLIGTDLSSAKSGGYSVDFTNSPFNHRQFDAVIFDPPYKLNGRPDVVIDAPYGVEVRTRWQDRMELIRLGAVHCADKADKFFLAKCQDQVVSGKVRWQTTFIMENVEPLGFELWDRLDLSSYRPQPDGTTQKHARSNSSTMLIFRRGGSGWRP